jgi:hypothetical protein
MAATGEDGSGTTGIIAIIIAIVGVIIAVAMHFVLPRPGIDGSAGSGSGGST